MFHDALVPFAERRIIKMNKLKTGKIWNSKWPALILMLVGACFMGYGISRGELAVVFTKAINICMECVGIG